MRGRGIGGGGRGGRSGDVKKGWGREALASIESRCAAMELLMYSK
jgi:hypothetical protein